MMNRAILVCQLLFLVFAVTVSANLTSAQNTSDRRMRVVTAAQIRSDQVTASPARWGTTSYIEKEVFKLLNSEREKQGLRPLIWNERVANIARLHSRNMVEQRFFDHRGKDGSIVSSRADKAGIKWTTIGENIICFFGASDPGKYAADTWMDSYHHKMNILNKSWKETGIGAIVAPDGTYYLTQVFLYDAR